MNVFDLYGFKHADLEAAREAVESTLGLQLLAHDSGYLGGLYYRLGEGREESFELASNFRDSEGELREPEFSDFGVLLYISWSSRTEELEKNLLARCKDIRLLRRESA